MYSVVLYLHSYIRWVVVAFAIIVVVRALRGWRSSTKWGPVDERSIKIFIASLDAQFLLGMLLYLALSPISRIIFSDSAAMKNSTLRFFGIEHIFGMFFAVMLAHVGRRRSTKLAKDAVGRHRIVFWFTTVSFVIMLVSIPWPFRPYGRPLVRMGPETGTASVVSANSGCPPVYATRCAACHGDNGRGDGVAAQSLKPPPRDFAADFMASRTDEQISKVIREGGSATGLSVAMPANRDLDDAQVLGLTRCVRSFSTKAGQP